MKHKYKVITGLGYTKGELKKNPVNFQLVLKVMTYNYAYDVQSEGDRSYYAFRLFQNSKDKKKIIRLFKKKLHSLNDSDYWGHKLHILQVAIRLNKANWIKKRIIREVISNNLDGDNPVDLSLFLKVGKKGVIEFLERNGVYHSKDKFVEYYPYQERNNKLIKLVNEYSIDSSLLSDRASLFLKDVREWKEAKRDRTPRFENFDSYIKFIKGNRLKGRNRVFFESFTNVQNQYIHNLLKQSTNRNELLGALAVIATNGFRGKTKEIIEFLDDEDRLIRNYSISILSKIKSESIRTLAVQKLNTPKDIRHGIELLSSNINKGDDDLILKAIEKVDNFDDLHNVEYGLLTLCKIGNPSLVQKSLKYLFYNSNCGVCRFTLINNYFDSLNLPTNEITALKFDSYSETRKLIKLRKKNSHNIAATPSRS